MIMMLTLVIEACLACIVAALVGFFLDRLRGLTNLGGLVLAAEAVLFAVIFPLYALGYLPFEQLTPAGKFQPTYLGTVYVVLEIAIWTCMLAGCVGYWFDKLMGTLAMELFSVSVALVCIFFSAIPSVYYELSGDLNLLLAVILIGIAGPILFSHMWLKGKGVRVLAALWFGFCVVCWIGYWAAGRLGLLLLTLPTVVVFGGFLYYVSQFTLPVQAGQKMQAFRSLLTYTLGTNYPYYVIDDWKNQQTHKLEKPNPRVQGDPFLQFFAGPGIVLNDCNHLAVITDGSKLWIAPPGLSFTRQFEQLYADVDLRPQLRVKTIQAETKDGIRVSVLFFTPHRIGTGGRQPALGEPFPYDEEAVLKAVWEQAIVDHTWKRDEQGVATEGVKRIPWDELAPMVAQPILKSIISNYTCNELHTPGDPRVKIAGDFRTQMKEAMQPMGIEMVGGGISNLVPPDDVVEQRIKNWEAEWKRKIDIELGEAEAEVARQLGPVWATAQFEVIDELTRILRRAEDGQVTEQALAFQLIEALHTSDHAAEILSKPGRGDVSEESLVRLLMTRRAGRL